MSTTLEPGGMELIIHTTKRMIRLDRGRSHWNHSLQIRMQLRGSMPHLLQTKALVFGFLADDFVDAKIWNCVYWYGMSWKACSYLRCVLFSIQMWQLYNQIQAIKDSATTSARIRISVAMTAVSTITFLSLCMCLFMQLCTPVHLLCVAVKIVEVFSPPQGKVGVNVARKRSANPESSFFSYLKDLRTRCDTLAQTPVKRLKVRKKTWLSKPALHP